MWRFALAGTSTCVRDMQCWQCGVRIKPGQKLCVYCGAKLIQDGEPEYDAPAERSGFAGRDRAGGEREQRPPAGSGSRGGRSPDEDGWSAEPDYDGQSDRYGSRERSRDDYYRPDGAEPRGRGDGRSPQRASGSRLPSRDESRSRDPMDDPRAPRGLRGASSAGRSTERGRGANEGQSHDDAEYEYDDYNPRDRANPRYLPRFDPDSAEYDAVADQRRQSRVHPRQDESRARVYDRDGGSARGGRDGAWEDPRAGRASRDERRYDGYGRGQRDAAADPRTRYGQERGGSYGAYGEDESAEYAATYDNRTNRHDRGTNQSRGGRGADAADQQGYGGGWDQYEGRNAGGFNAPAMGQPNAQGWGNEAWAPGADPNSWAPPGAGYAPGGKAVPAKKRGRGGLIAAVLSLLVVVVLAGGGFLARGKLLALLHRGGGGGASTPIFATYTPGPTPTALPNYKLFVSTNAKYAIEYPAAWTIQNTNNSSGGYDYLDTFQQASPPAEVGIEAAAALNPLSDTQIIASEVNGATQSGMKFSQIGNDVTVNIGGESWTRRDYSVTTSNGVTLHMAILATHHASHGYAVVLTASTSAFAQIDSGVFKTMLGTFRFTS